MAPKRPAPAGTDKKARRTGVETPALKAAQPPDGERRLVDVDPWAMLLESLMEVPEEGPAKRKSGSKAG